MSDERNRIIRGMAIAGKAMNVYDGASSAWEGMKTAKTASQLMRVGAERLTSEDGLRSPSELAIAAVFTGIATVFLLGRR